MKKIKKLFWLPFSKVITSAETFRLLYHKDHLDFEAKDPQRFTLTYEDDFRTKINDALETGTDESYMDEVSQNSDGVSNKLKEARKYFNVDIRYWVGKTFPDDEAKKKEFGFDNYANAKRTHKLMIDFMNTLKGVVDKNKTEMLAKGTPLAIIDKAEVLGQELRDEKKQQQVKLRERNTLAQNRTIKYNAVWSVMSEINEGAKLVYSENFAHMAQYNMPQYEEVHTYSDDVPKNSTAKVFKRKLKPKAVLKIHNTGSAEWMIGFVNKADSAVTSGIILQAGITMEVTASQLGDVSVNHFLNITNNTNTDGSYSVYIE